jgi:hypothetical protein
MKLLELKKALEKLQADRADLFEGVLVVSHFEKITNVPAFIDSQFWD